MVLKRLSLIVDASARSQILVIGAICFACPGMYNAITAMAGGIADAKVNNLANALLYATFALFSLVAPAINAKLGAKGTLLLGTVGYTLFVVALYCFRSEVAGGTFVVAAAAVNGISAALLWTAQGQLTLAYPTREVKGMFFAMFWVMFNVGGVVGGFVTFGANYNADEDSAAASTTTFLIFIVVMCVGSMLVALLRNPADVIRPDGSRVHIAVPPPVRQELKAMLSLFCDRRLVLLLPLFLHSNWFFPYHFGVFNAGLFNSRTQGWNTAWYWGSEMVGALAIGKFLDSKRIGSPRRRALLALLLLFVYVNLTWFWALQILKDPAINTTTGTRTPRLDFNDKAGASPFLLYFSWGFVDLTLSSWIYWVLGQLTDDPNELARFVGLYKAVQASGAALGWALGDVVPIVQLQINWSMFAIAAGAAASAVSNMLPNTLNGSNAITNGAPAVPGAAGNGRGLDNGCRKGGASGAPYANLEYADDADVADDGSREALLLPLQAEPDHLSYGSDGST